MTRNPWDELAHRYGISLPELRGVAGATVSATGLTLDPHDPVEAAMIAMVETNRRKRADYTISGGDPFWNFTTAGAQTGLSPAQVVEVFIATKQARLAALMTNGTEPANESVLDTKLDRAVYAVIALAMAQAESRRIDEHSV